MGLFGLPLSSSTKGRRELKARGSSPRRRWPPTDGTDKNEDAQAGRVFCCVFFFKGVFYLAGNQPRDWSKELSPLLLAGVRRRGGDAAA